MAKKTQKNSQNKGFEMDVGLIGDFRIPLDPTSQKLLNRVVEFYQRSFEKSRKAKAYLKKQGIIDNGLFDTFRLGFADGSLLQTIPESGEVIEVLNHLGILDDNGKELFADCVVFPVFDDAGDVVYLYGRRIKGGVSHDLYLSGGHRGVLNREILKTHNEVILVESVLDFLLLYQTGLKNTIPCFGSDGLTEDHIQALKDNNTRLVSLIFSDAVAGKNIQEKLSVVPEIFSSVIDLPRDYDVARYLQDFSAKQLEALIEEARPARSNIQIEETGDGFVLIICRRPYIVKGLEISPNRLKANVRAVRGKRFHIDTFDLYSARSRKQFITDVTGLHKIESATIEQDVDQIITAAEQYIEKQQKDSGQTNVSVTGNDRRSALRLGQRKNLLDTIVEDITQCGYVGEETNKLLCYLAMTSRKMETPLSLLILSGSGAGKTSLQDSVLKLCPPEDLVKLTSLTGKALFYKKEMSLSHKVLAIEEGKGAEEADYAIRNLITADELVIEATVKDSYTGKLTTMTNTVKCHTSVFKTTTDPSTNPETRSRFLILSVDESREQTRRILDYQRHMETPQGYQEKLQREQIINKHRNFQRLLQPVAVFNPYATMLTYMDDRLQVRRDHPKYIAIIKAIAFIHQMQREIKKMPDGTEYIEVTLEDIALANKLAQNLFGRTLDELTEPSRRLLDLIDQMVDEMANERGVSSDTIGFTRRQIREYTSWSDYQVKTYLKQLVDLEYLSVLSGRNGQLYRYQLRCADLSKQQQSPLLGLKKIDQLRKEAGSATVTIKPGEPGGNLAMA